MLAASTDFRTEGGKLSRPAVATTAMSPIKMIATIPSARFSIELRSVSGAVHRNVPLIQTASHSNFKRLAFPFLDANQTLPVRFAKQPAIQTLAASGLIFEVANLAAGFPVPLLPVEFDEVGRILAGVDLRQAVFRDADIRQAQLAFLQNPDHVRLWMPVHFQIHAASSKFTAEVDPALHTALVGAAAIDREVKIREILGRA